MTKKKASAGKAPAFNKELQSQFKSLLEDCPSAREAREDLAHFVKLHKVSGTDLIGLEDVILEMFPNEHNRHIEANYEIL